MTGMDRRGDETAARSAHQRVVEALALEVLRIGVGGRIPTALQLQDALGVGSGTVNKALREIGSTGAARLRARGHQGTVVEELDPAALWRTAQLPPLRIALPPAGSLEASGIALAVRARLARLNVGVELDFLRGAPRRLALVDSSPVPRVALVSRGAAHADGVLDDPEHSWLDLGPQTYYRHDTLVVLRRPDTPVRRIARDPDSPDHEALSAHLHALHPGATLVDCSFPDLPGTLLDGRADAGVWHEVLTGITPEQAGLVRSPFAWPDGLDDEITHAVLVWRAEHVEIDRLLALVDPVVVRERIDELAARGVHDPQVRETVPWF